MVTSTKAINQIDVIGGVAHISYTDLTKSTEPSFYSAADTVPYERSPIGSVCQLVRKELEKGTVILGAKGNCDAGEICKVRVGVKKDQFWIRAECAPTGSV